MSPLLFWTGCDKPADHPAAYAAAVSPPPTRMEEPHKGIQVAVVTEPLRPSTGEPGGPRGLKIELL